MGTTEQAGAGLPAHDSRIELSLPARTDMAATLRVVVASLGADVGFTLDEIDDVRLAVNEVFSSIAEIGGNARFRVVFDPSPGQLTMEMSSPDSPTLELDELATTILSSVIDHVEADAGTIRLSKRAHEATA